jgi:hypothetical protein
LFGKEKEKKRFWLYFILFFKNIYYIWIIKNLGPFQFGGLKPLLKRLIGWAGHAVSLLLWLDCFSFCIIFLSAELQQFEHPIKADGMLSFLVIGDWGRR